MALSQVQIIQSLGEALSWFEREISWGAPAGELTHLTGRIGELYTAMITRGHMATMVNQKGYDVMSAENERISVKTITTANNVRFNKNTIAEVDRLIILRINIEEGEASIEEVFDETIDKAIPLLREIPTGWSYTTYVRKEKVRNLDGLKVVKSATAEDLVIKQYESLAVTVEKDGELIEPALPILREVGKKFRIPSENGNGNPKNTRTFGSDIINALNPDSDGK